MAKQKEIIVKDTSIRTMSQNGFDYICITDIARQKNPIEPHKQECYASEAWNIPQLSLPITERLADEELSIPMSPCMTKEQMEFVIQTINEFA